MPPLLRSKMPFASSGVLSTGLHRPRFAAHDTATRTRTRIVVDDSLTLADDAGGQIGPVQDTPKAHMKVGQHVHFDERVFIQTPLSDLVAGNECSYPVLSEPGAPC